MKLTFCKLLITVTLFTMSLFSTVNDVACTNTSTDTSQNAATEIVRMKGNMMEALLSINNTKSLSYTERDEIINRLIEIHQKRNVDPQALIKIINKESRWSTTQFNLAGSGAIGLIQWTKSTLSCMGYTTKDVINMSILEQLNLVDEYIELLEHKLHYIENYEDLYLLVFYPEALGKFDCYIIAKKGTKKYLQNKNIDMNKDGIITVDDFRSYACI